MEAVDNLVARISISSFANKLFNHRLLGELAAEFDRKVGLTCIRA